MNPSRKHQSWVDTTVFESMNDARVLENFLRDKGFESRTYDDKLLRYFLFLRPPLVTFRIQVRKSEFKIVTNILDTEAPAILEKAIRCPACGSLRVNYPQMTRKFFMPTLLLHLGIIFRIIDHECYCETCHCIWNLPKSGVSAVPKAQVTKPFPFK
jgi:hypothetical protein